MAMSEREALEIWRAALCDYVRTDERDLTARQQAILMTVALSAGPHTVRGLAAALDIAKPAVTRSLDTLERLGFVRRRRDENDLRSVFIERTVEGTSWLRSFAGHILAAERQDVADPSSGRGRAAA